MSGFNYDIKYLEGKKNVLADTLSRYYKNPHMLPPIIRKPQHSIPPQKTTKNVTFTPQTLTLNNLPDPTFNMQRTYAQVASAAATTRSQAPSPTPATSWKNKPALSAVDPDDQWTKNFNPFSHDFSHVNCDYNPCRG